MANNASSQTSAERFAISDVGMRELHANREPSHLVKELIQNCFDETPDVTVCRVIIKPQQHNGCDAVLVRVEDDGPGFANIADAWTLMGHTVKRKDPTKRGRFNMGEKELVSVAIEASIKTVGHTVEFPEGGSRVVKKNRRRSGTIVEALMPWTTEQAHELVERLGKFRPTDCRLVINGSEVETREPVAVRRAPLNTVIYRPDGVGSTRRITEIHMLDAADEECWLYEMGIPIQPITSPWDVDIQQKVPMPPNRDTVSEAYLTDVYAEVLNEVHEIMEREQFGEQWVKQAVQDPRVSPAAIASTVRGRYGDRVLLTSPDANANMMASQEGYELVNPRSLSEVERVRFREDACLQTTHQVFGQERPRVTAHPPQPGSAQAAFARWVRDMAALCGLRPQVRFYDEPGSNVLASCEMDSANPFMTFNAGRLGDEFFAAPYGRIEQLDLVIHELGHALSNRPMEHGPAWGEAVAKAGAHIAYGLSQRAAGE